MDFRNRIKEHRDGLRPEDVLEAVEIAKRIAGLDLDSLVENRKTPLEKAIEKADAGYVEALSRARRKKPKVHWRTAKKKRKETYHRVTKPRRQMRKAEQLRGGASGYYQYLRTGWIKSGTKFTLTEQEFTEVLWPAIKGRLPMFIRYNPAEPVSLYNIYAVDVDNEKEVLFDGKEEQLRAAGYLL